MKSSFCSGGSYVEVFIEEDAVLVKDSDGDYVAYTFDEWKAFISGVKNGEFDIKE